MATTKVDAQTRLDEFSERVGLLERAVLAVTAENRELRERLDAIADEVVTGKVRTRHLEVVDDHGGVHVYVHAGDEFGELSVHANPDFSGPNVQLVAGVDRDGPEPGPDTELFVDAFGAAHLNGWKNLAGWFGTTPPE